MFAKRFFARRYFAARYWPPAAAAAGLAGPLTIVLLNLGHAPMEVVTVHVAHEPVLGLEMDPPPALDLGGDDTCDVALEEAAAELLVLTTPIIADLHLED